MAAVITVTPDLSNADAPRLGVRLTGWTADARLTVYRIHPDTRQYPVRGITATSGGAAFVWDYEAPLGVPLTYVALDAGSQVSSPATTLPSTSAVLSAPGLPSYSARVELLEVPAVSRQRPSSVLQPLGRATSVVLQDSRKSETFGVTIKARSQAEADRLDQILDVAGTLLLRIPLTRLDWQYVAVSDSSWEQVVPWRGSSPAVGGGLGKWERLTMACSVTDAPIGGVYGDPTASYGAVRSAVATYQDATTKWPTYLASLVGV